MIALYDSLSEKDRKRYAAVEAQRLEHGGITYIVALFGCDEKTIKRGLSELGDEEKSKNPRSKNVVLVSPYKGVKSEPSKKARYAIAKNSF